MRYEDCLHETRLALCDLHLRELDRLDVKIASAAAVDTRLRLTNRSMFASASADAHIHDEENAQIKEAAIRQAWDRSPFLRVGAGMLGGAAVGEGGHQLSTGINAGAGINPWSPEQRAYDRGGWHALGMLAGGAAGGLSPYKNIRLIAQRKIPAATALPPTPSPVASVARGGGGRQAKMASKLSADDIANLALAASAGMGTAVGGANLYKAMTDKKDDALDTMTAGAEVTGGLGLGLGTVARVKEIMGKLKRAHASDDSAPIKEAAVNLPVPNPYWGAARNTGLGALLGGGAGYGLNELITKARGEEYANSSASQFDRGGSMGVGAALGGLLGAAKPVVQSIQLKSNAPLALLSGLGASASIGGLIAVLKGSKGEAAQQTAQKVVDQVAKGAKPAASAPAAEKTLWQKVKDLAVAPGNALGDALSGKVHGTPQEQYKALAKSHPKTLSDAEVHAKSIFDKHRWETDGSWKFQGLKNEVESALRDVQKVIRPVVNEQDVTWRGKLLKLKVPVKPTDEQLNQMLRTDEAKALAAKANNAAELKRMNLSSKKDFFNTERSIQANDLKGRAEALNKDIKDHFENYSIKKMLELQ